MQSGPAKTPPGNSICGFGTVEWVDVNSQRWYVDWLGRMGFKTDLSTIALKSMGGKFITGLVELVGGEKDPRNLMIVFSVVKVVLVEFDIVVHIEVSTKSHNLELAIREVDFGNCSFCLMLSTAISRSPSVHLQTTPTALPHRT